MSASGLLTIRYPSGATEYRLRERAPVVGENVTFNGHDWTVERVNELPNGEIVVTLRSQGDALDATPEPSPRQSDGLRDALHARAARFHEEAARFQEQHAEEMTAKNEPAKAARAMRLAKKEQALADSHRASALRGPQAS